MNFVGKILTVFILFLSIVFLAVSVVVFQTHRSWRDAAIANKKTVGELQETVKRLETELEAGKDRLALEQAARRFALATLQTKYEQAEAQYQVRSQEFATLQQTAGNLSQVVSTTAQTVEATLKQNESLRTSLRDTQVARDSVYDNVVALTDKRNELEVTKQILADRNAELNAVYTRAMHILAVNDLDPNAPTDGKPPTVEGEIVRVGAKDLIEISIGSDDGLKQGHTLEVFRDNAYLGRVVVRETSPDKAVVQIIPEFRKGIIKVGDRVATKLG